MRKGDYKLVLNGRVVESEEPRAEVFLSDLSRDPGEKNNLADELPEIRDELRKAALDWRDSIEEKWERDFASNYALT